MKIKEINIQETYLSLKGSDVRFARRGIYVIRGSNGAGKTTLIERIVYGDPAVRTEVEPGERSREARFRRIAYVPQTIPKTRMHVADYLTMGQMLDQEEVKGLLKRLGLGDLDPETPMDRLSGGERTKLCLIQALMKKTPYLFLDEPTNNLDDASTAALVEILEELSDSRTIILATHDPRLASLSARQILLRDHQVLPEYTDGGAENPGEANTALIPKPLGLAKTFMANRVNIMTFLVALLSSAFLLLGDLVICQTSYALRENYSRDTMLVYRIDNIYGQLNETYCDYAKVRLRGDIGARITYEDVPEIAASGDVEGVYILYDQMYDQIYQKLEKHSGGKPCPISVPEVVVREYAENMGLGDALILKMGRPPRDQKYEIALPMEEVEQLAKTAGVDRPAQMVGKTISYDGRQWILSGITLFDFAWYSFHERDDRLFYTYEKETYESFRIKSLEYKRQNEYRNVEYIDNMILRTKKGKQKALLEDLISRYPADNYCCAAFDRALVASENQPLTVKLFLANLVFAAVLAGLLLVVERNQWEEDAALMALYRTYYLDGGFVRRVYGRAHFGKNLLMALAAAVPGMLILHRFPGMGMVYVAGIVAATGAVLVGQRWFLFSGAGA